jgi:hypothetical protein
VGVERGEPLDVVGGAGGVPPGSGADGVRHRSTAKLYLLHTINYRFFIHITDWPAIMFYM